MHINLFRSFISLCTVRYRYVLLLLKRRVLYVAGTVPTVGTVHTQFWRIYLTVFRQRIVMPVLGITYVFVPVVPEDGEDAVEMQDDDNTYIEDQSDVDARKAEIARLAREAALAKRSSAVKRDMPRPTEMNNAVLRPLNSDPPLTELQVEYCAGFCNFIIYYFFSRVKHGIFRFTAF